MPQTRPSRNVLLSDVTITGQFVASPSRRPNFQRENEAFKTVAKCFVKAPETVLNVLVELAVDLCEAGTAGISLEEIDSNGKRVFRCVAIAGELKEMPGDATHHDLSPCGTCLDSNRPQMFSQLDKVHTYLQDAPRPFAEALWVPCRVEGGPTGAFWIVAHDAGRHFDYDDLRLMTSLVDFAALALSHPHTQARLPESQKQTVLEHSLLRDAFTQAPGPIALLNGPDHKFVFVNSAYLALFGREQILYKTMQEVFPEFREQGHLEMLDRVYQTGETFVAKDREVNLNRSGREDTIYLDFSYHPMRNTSGEVEGILFQAVDVTERVIARSQLEARVGTRTAELQESEKRFRLVANATPVLIWMAGPDKLCTYFNQSWLNFTGRPLAAELGNGWADGVHPDDLQKCLETYNQSFDGRWPFQMEYRLQRHDGEYRWVLNHGVPIIDADGIFTGYIGSCVDVTDRKVAEEALATLGGRLIEAQEQERSRIARELHDDLSQRLAMLAIGLQTLKTFPPDSSAKLRRRAEQLYKSTAKLSTDVHALSHELHSSQLEYLGVVSAMKNYCEEVAEQQDVEIKFTHNNVPRALPWDISLSLFRVLQEGLRNAVKYSGVRYFEADLRGVSGEIQLTIRDSGAGFDPEIVANRRGLGLISMRERISLVKGAIAIMSKPRRGTEINVRVPIADEVPATLELAA